MLGRASVSELALPLGSYGVSASFGQPANIGGQPLDFTDSYFNGASATGTLFIGLGNAPPQANDDAAVVNAGRTVAIDVAANDIDVDGNLNALSARLVQAPAGGTAVVDAATGRVLYTANPLFDGVDRFLYDICDTGADGNAATSEDNLCATAVVAVTVLPNTNTGDGSAPTSTITLAPAAPNGQNSWYTRTVNVSVTATDGDDPTASGVAETRCILDPATPPLAFGELRRVWLCRRRCRSDGRWGP